MRRFFFSIQQLARAATARQVIPNPCQPCDGHGAREKTKRCRKDPSVVAKATASVSVKAKPAGTGPSGRPLSRIHINPTRSSRAIPTTCTASAVLHERIVARHRYSPLDGYAVRYPRKAERKVFRLRGKGIRACAASHGDLLCHVIVETPVNLTQRQRELLQEFESISGKDTGRHNPRAKSWMEKVKEFFES